MGGGVALRAVGIFSIAIGRSFWFDSMGFVHSSEI
jgi:hypothetical protein